MLRLIDKELETCSGGVEYESGSVPYLIQKMVGNPDYDFSESGIFDDLRRFTYNNARGVAVVFELLVLAGCVTGLCYGAKKLNSYLKDRESEKEINISLLWKLFKKII